MTSKSPQIDIGKTILLEAKKCPPATHFFVAMVQRAEDSGTRFVEK